MAKETHVLHSWGPWPAGEAISAGMVCMVTGNAVYKATAGARVVGVALFDHDAGDAVYLQNGFIEVLTAASVTADANITVSSTAGKVRTALAGEVVIGQMNDTVSGAGSGRATIVAPGSGTTALPFPSAAPTFGQIADAQSASAGIGVAAAAGTITSVTARFQNAIVKGGTGITVDLYRVRSGVATKIYSVTDFAAAGADYVALADLALVVKAGAGNNALVAGDWLYMTVTNNTGSAIDPGASSLAIA